MRTLPGAKTCNRACTGGTSPKPRWSTLLFTAAMLSAQVVLLGSPSQATGAPSGAPTWGARFTERTQEAEPLPLTNLRFVGVATDRNASAVSMLGEERARLLLAFREAAPLDQLLARGQPFRSEQLLELVNWGLLEQEGMQFHTTIPVLVGEDVEGFRRRVREVSSVLTSSVAPAFEDLRRVMVAAGGEGSFPAVATWVFRERVWNHLVEDGTVALHEAIAQQRHEFPERGWWGAFWYVGPRNNPVPGFQEVTTRDRTLHFAARRGDAPEDVSDLIGMARAVQFLGFVDGDGRRVRNPHVFADLVDLGWIDPDGTSHVPVYEWTPDRAGSVAAAVEAAAEAVATAVTVLRQLAAQLRDEPGLAHATVAYTELAPELMLSLDEMGLGLLIPPGSGSTADSAEVAGVGGSPEGPQRSRLSAVIWEGLPQEAEAIRLPW